MDAPPQNEPLYDVDASNTQGFDVTPEELEAIARDEAEMQAAAATHGEEGTNTQPAAAQGDQEP